LQEVYYKECAHFKGWVAQNLTPKEALEKRQRYDKFKEKVAIESGYEFLVIPYWLEKGCKFKAVIDKKIQELIAV